MIRGARPNDLVSLSELEHVADGAFAAIGMEPIADAQPTPTGVLAGYADAGRAWVWVDASDRPVGFVVVDVIDGAAHVEQVSVDPGHAHRGIGASLIDFTARWAAAEGLDALTLITFRDVPWNRPYYQRLGFEVLGQGELTPGLRALRAREAALGLDRWPRVAMRRPSRRSEE